MKKKQRCCVKRFWLSWYEPVDAADDSRPLRWPLPAGVRYWVSGQRGDGAHTLCAVVDAESEEAAKATVQSCWTPDPKEWRFCEEKPGSWRPGDRFPW